MLLGSPTWCVPSLPSSVVTLAPSTSLASIQVASRSLRICDLLAHYKVQQGLGAEAVAHAHIEGR